MNKCGGKGRIIKFKGKGELEMRVFDFVIVGSFSTKNNNFCLHGSPNTLFNYMYLHNITEFRIFCNIPIYFSVRRYVSGASILSILLTFMIRECITSEIEEQTIQPPNESWRETQQKETVSENSDIIIRNTNKLKDTTIAFINKPSKFDEHVEDDQYVDNPLLLMGVATATTVEPSTNVTILGEMSITNKTVVSANETTSRTQNYTQSCNETSAHNSTVKCDHVVKNLTSTNDHLKLVDVDSTNENLHSALVRKRNSADIRRSGNESIELPSDLFNVKPSNRNSNIYYKTNIYGKLYEYKNASRNFPLKDDKTLPSLYAGLSAKSYPRYQDLTYASARVNVPKMYHKSYFNDANNLFTFKLKKETEDYRMLEKRIRRRNRVRRSVNMYSLPFNEVLYRRPHRRRYYLHNNDRMDMWDQLSDQHRRYVRFPLPADTAFRPSRPLNAPPPPPPPPPGINWSPPQLPQYAAFHQNLPPVPSMGPRSPRLVFRDPVEPGTLQAPFSPNGLQDLTAPEDNKGKG